MSHEALERCPNPKCRSTAIHFGQPTWCYEDGFQDADLANICCDCDACGNTWDVVVSFTVQRVTKGLHE